MIIFNEPEINVMEVVLHTSNGLYIWKVYKRNDCKRKHTE